MKRRAMILMAALVAVSGTAGCPAPTRGMIAQSPFSRSLPPATTTRAAGTKAGPVDGAALIEPARLALLLLDATSTTEQRELAAARLLADGTPEAIEVLKTALRIGPAANAAAQQAAAIAVAGSARPDPSLIEPLLALLVAPGPANVKREVGRALSSFRTDDAVRTRLVEIATSAAATAARQGAVAGLARLPGRDSAQALMLLLDGDAPEALERDAADALRTMTGLAIAPDDLLGWQAWWERTAGLDETSFTSAIFASRVADELADERRADAAVSALLLVSRQRFRSVTPSEQPAVLEEYLRSSIPEMRETGARLVLEEADLAHDIAPGVMRLVRAAITDPHGPVREIAAKIVQRRNDAAAIEPMLAQIGREPLQPARLAQIRALGGLRDARALPTLLGLLTDPSPGVRAAAARAAAELANASGPDAVRQAAAAIRQAFLAASPLNQNGRRQRAELITALADLNDPALSSFYRDLLNGQPRPSRDVRVQTLRGMGTLGDPNLSDTIVRFVAEDDEEDPKVREEAVKALAKTSLGFERQGQLRALLQPNSETTESVRQAAWEALVTLLPKARADELNSLAGYLRKEGQHERRLVVLAALADLEAKRGDLEQLAWCRHKMADALMEDLNRPGEAADLYRQALQFSLDHSGEAGTIRARAENTLSAYLRARRFDDVIAFAGEMIRRDASFVESVGLHVKREAEALENGGHPETARQLIETVLRVTPPLLDPRSQQQLRDQLNVLPAPLAAPGG